MTNHKIEPELLRPPPRKVVRRGRRGYAMVVVQTLFVPFIALALVMALWWMHQLFVATSGQVTPGFVTQRRKMHDTANGTYYLVYYRYIAGGVTYRERTNVPKPLFDEATVGSVVPVRASLWWPGHDSELLLIGRNPLSEVWGLFIPVAGCLFGVIFGGYFIYIVPRIRRRLIIDGTPIVGTLTSKSLVSSAYRGQCFTLLYLFEPPGGAGAVTGGMRVSEEMYKEATEGAGCTILYNPARPGQNVIYEFADFRAVG